MKKRYIMPQVCVISGEFECHILAGSGGGGSHEIGDGGDGGNKETGTTEGTGGGDIADVGAKEHYNAWDAWEDD